MIKIILLLSLSFLIGQYTMVIAYNPDSMYNRTINLAVESFKYGCLVGKNNKKDEIDCKIYSLEFMKDITSVKKG